MMDMCDILNICPAIREGCTVADQVQEITSRAPPCSDCIELVYPRLEAWGRGAFSILFGCARVVVVDQFWRRRYCFKESFTFPALLGSDKGKVP